MKIAACLLLGFALGMSTYYVLFERSTTQSHWKAIESYQAYLSNPANYTPDAGTGLSVTTPPGDIEPNLAALVAAGELNHVDLVLPSVPASKAVAKHWMTFCDSHKEIVYISGNPSYTAFKPAGTQPLHLNIWFRDADASIVQKLIQELETTYGKQTG